MTRLKLCILSSLCLAAMVFGLTLARAPKRTSEQDSKPFEPSRPQLPPNRNSDSQNSSNSIGTSEQRARATALLGKKRSEEEQNDLLRLYTSLPEDLRALIERHALDRDQELKKALAFSCVKLLAEENDTAKIASLASLHNLNDSAGKESALKLLDGTAPVVKKAIMYLGRINANEAFPLVSQLALNATSVEIKGTALRNLVLVGGAQHPEKVIEVLTSALSDHSRQVRVEALRILPRFAGYVNAGIRARLKELAKPILNGEQDESHEQMAAQASLEAVEVFAQGKRAAGIE
jgi:hypothetical protein